MRVLHVGLGPVGRTILTDLVERGLGRPVGAIDSSADLAGKSLADLTGGAPEDVVVGTTLDAFHAWKSVDVAIVATVSDLSACAPTLLALLDRGLTVVSTCEELVWPWTRHPELAQELDALARSTGARLLGTGVNPGFLMDTLAVACSSVCREVRAVHAWRIQDASDRRVPFQRKIGAGLSDEEFHRRARAGTLRHVGLGESLHMVASGLGLIANDWEESIEPLRTEAEVDCAFGTVPAGGIAGVRQVATGYFDGRTIVELSFEAAVGRKDPHDRVLLEGDPRVDLRIDGGVHGDVATAAIVLNAVPALREARPGLHTMLSIPIVRFRRA